MRVRVRQLQFLRSSRFVTPPLYVSFTLNAKKHGQGFVNNHFTGGPLMTDERERTCVLKMLEDFEVAHSWPTAWIVTALRKEWYMT